MNFEINLIFLIKPLFLHAEKVKTKILKVCLTILWGWRLKVNYNYILVCKMYFSGQ